MDIKTQLLQADDEKREDFHAQECEIDLGFPHVTGDMAVYFDHPVDAPESSGVPVQLAWHHTAPFLAVASISSVSGGAVDVYKQQGDFIDRCHVERPHQPTVLHWHPTKPVLAVGWGSGEVLLLTCPSGDQAIVPSTHSVSCTLLQWSGFGSRLVTGDQNGVLAVWNIDAKGRLQGNWLVKHDYKNKLTCCIFKPATPGDDVEKLARASVSGDKKALDKFGWNKLPLKIGPQEELTFYISTTGGTVYVVDEQGKSSDLLSVEGAIKQLYYFDNRDVLAVITETMVLSQYSVGPPGGAQELKKVKLSSNTRAISYITWTDNGLLATTSNGDNIIRLWDFEQEENYILSLDENLGFEKDESVCSLAYCPGKGILAAGTNCGHIAMWGMVLQSSSNKKDNTIQWKLQTPVEIGGSVTQLDWCSSLNLLGANNSNTVLILSEHVMSAHFSQQVAAVQLSPTQLSITQFDPEVQLSLQSDLYIQGICARKGSITVWNGKQVTVYDINGTVLRISGSFSCDSHVVAVHEENLYTVAPNKVQICTPRGIVKQLLSFSKTEGNPVLLSVCQSYLVVGTDTAHIRVFDLSRRDAKAHSNTKNLAELIPNLGALKSVKCNANGSKVSILITQVNGKPDHKVYFYDVEMDTITHFDFFSGRPSSSFMVSEESERQQFEGTGLSGRCPISHFWDETEPRLFVCETVPVTPESSSSAPMDAADVSVVTLFCTEEHGLLLHDSYLKPSGLQSLLAMDVPYYYFICKPGEQDPSDQPEAAAPQPQPSKGPSAPKMVSRRALRDFVGLENCDKTTRDSMLNFSFYLTIGDMDEALKSIKKINSTAVWENMARMCVKTRRMDVARFCLGKMGNASAAKALREAEHEPEPEARVAMLAMQLGMLEDAERLYKSCKRYDLLNNYYQASAQWVKALETAETHDRIHLRTTYYNYAKYLESIGSKAQAVTFFEKSDSHALEVPRMLQNDPSSLEIYVNKMRDKKIYKWWAQYLESQSDRDAALKYYELAQDYVSLVRVFCYMGNIQKASEVANDTGDRAASYQLARHYERHDDIQQAVYFYTRAQTYNNAIRLCKEHSLDDQLMNLALLSNPEDMMEAAYYYEERGINMDRAVTLYRKAGYVSKALELAFATKQFSALQLIAEDLNKGSDPALLTRCSDFFIEHSQFEKAVKLLVDARKYHQALELCVTHNLAVTEELAETMSVAELKDMTEEDRNELLERIAHCCMRQGNYHLAAKKYIQAGNKLKAMKALLKSRDTEKIIFFANVSRQKELFILAANYLFHSLDWRTDREILKTIIGFYSKGRAPEHLAGFFEACAELEIDDYQNYEKALDALTAGFKCLSKFSNASGKLHGILSDMQQKISLIQKFVHIRRLYADNAEEAIGACEALLEEPDLDHAVRVGDAFGFLVEHYCQQGQYQMAYRKLEELQKLLPSQNLKYYISPASLKALQREMGVTLDHSEHNMKNEEDDDEEVVEESIKSHS